MGITSSKERPNLIKTISELAIPVCESEGIEFVHSEFAVISGMKILRLYIDKDGGVTIDDCAKISRELSNLFDVKLDIPGKYSLEVSSPGLDRPLVKPEDFLRFKGKKVNIKLFEPLSSDSNRKNFKGILKDSDENFTKIELENEEVSIPFDKIKSARLNPEI
ncbi:MAG: ribosome maturation factor RimP [Desulforegulaceae bacterium]|nr:ribosome maturation factor RimP [Desulforegulaceae bacterium]